MPGRVDEDPKLFRLRLCLGLDAADGDRGVLGGVQVVDVDIEVCLLLHVAGRPGRATMVGDALKCDGARRGAQLDPVDPLADVTADDLLVELGKCTWIGTVQCDEIETTDRLLHRLQRSAPP